MTELKKQLAETIEIIEHAYEFSLAYAAQGRSQELVQADGSGIRSYLQQMADALQQLPALAESIVNEIENGAAKESVLVFIKRLATDASCARTVVQAVLATSSISSQLADNLNASIHVRTVLTDIFLIDEILKAA